MIKLLPKRTDIAGRIPTGSDLMVGEIAINSSDKVLFTKVANGDVVNLSGAPMVHTHPISDIVGLQDAIDSKVDKVSGMGLSSEDYTAEEKNKLAGIEDGAEVNVATNLGQTRSLNDYTITSSTGNNTTLQPATYNRAGVMAGGDKSKLDGIEPSAQVNVPTNLSQSRTEMEYTVESSTGDNTTLASATLTEAGVMSATDKTRLNDIHSSYNATQWDTAHGWGDHSQAGYELASNKGVANGYAGLGGDGKVPAAQLPSFVEDVLEYSSQDAFPATGETGKLYVALDTDKVYRWSGSVYVYITSGAVDNVNGKDGVVVLSTSDIGEGSNQYFTTARARNSISASGDLSYNASTGTVSFSETYSTASELLTAIKTVDGSGSGLDADLLDGQSIDFYRNASNLNAGTVSTARLPSAALVGDTTYTAGTGLTLTGTSFSLSGEQFTSTLKNKLDGIESGAQVNVGTNLGQSRNSTSYTITSSTGSNTTISSATTSVAGVMTAADKEKLNGIDAGATAGAAVTSVNGKTGDVTITKGDVGLGSVRNVSSYSQTESNGRYVSNTGDAMSGSLRINHSDDGVSDLQVGGDVAFGSDVNTTGTSTASKFKTGNCEMVYNNTTKSLDFNFT